MRRPTRLAAFVTAIILFAGVSVVGARAPSKSDQLEGEILQSDGRARNVILLVGDGMGTSEVTSARNYEVGAAGHLSIDSLLLTGQVTTYSVLEADPSAPDYTPESASTATAWSTGMKTADGRISTAPGTDVDLENLVDRAEAAGMLTGNVSTAEITDATPAAPMSHVTNRSCQGPADMGSCPADNKSAGGLGSIAEQAIDNGVDVILGGGRQRWEQLVTGGPYVGQTVIAQAQAEGYRFVTDRAGLMSLRGGRSVLGLFTAGNMSMNYTGLPAAVGGSGPQACNEGQRPANEPSLAEMTRKAIDLLDGGRGHRGSRGFFLQVESASIDKRDHAAQPCEQIGEMVNFDQAVAAALDFAARDRNTLVIVTADHSHTSLIVEAGYAGPGLYSKLITHEGQVMTMHYGTALPGGSQEHTGGTVPVYARGKGAAELTGLNDQTDLFRAIVKALRI